MITIAIESAFGMTLHHDYFLDDPPSQHLMIMLPGRGYTCDSPLLRYIKQIGRNQGYDVLCIRYAIHVTQIDNWISRLSDIQADTSQAISQVMQHTYQNVCIVAKSLGTPMAGALANQLDVPSKSVLMLTPIQSAMTTLPDIRSLAIIGTADPAYYPDDIVETGTQSWQVYDDLNHSLEYKGDWRRSLDILPSILSSCETFIQESKLS